MISDWKEIYKYREFLKNSVSKDLRTRYKGSFLGFLWTFLNPLLMLVVYSILFSFVLRMDVKDYPVFLFCTLLPWNFFVSSVQVSSSIIVSSSNLIKKIYFPLETLPLSVVLASCANYLLSIVILVPAMTIFGYYPNINYLWFPLILFCQIILTMGLSFLVSCLTVYFRDLEHMIGIFLMALFYLTPVLYPITMVPEEYRYIFHWNPMSVIITSYRDIFYYNKTPDLYLLTIVLLFSIVCLILFQYIFKKLKFRFIEEI
ncbi:ABC transporter permease [Paenibacillus dendritiformis]|nr:ABC transporter permease [Paenibacillus dendritiformis]